jgi:DedD protein
MDQALKARLIGAAVLVVLAVLLIPEMLSGRKPAGQGDGPPAGAHGTRSFTIDLGSGTAGPMTAPAASPAASPAPSPGLASTSGPPAAAQPAVQPGPAPAPSAVEGPAPTVTTPVAAQSAPATQAPPPAPSIPGRGGWAVQVGAFGSAATADKLARELQSAGFEAYVAPVSRAGKALNRVRVGPESERSRAEALATSLKARGLPATVVAND